MKENKKIISLLIGFAGVVAFPQFIGVTTDLLYLTNSIFSIFLWLGCSFVIYLSIGNIDWEDKRATILATVFSFLFSTCMSVGSALDSTEYIVFGDLERIASIVLFTIFLTVLVRRVWDYLSSSVFQQKRLIEGYTRKQMITVFVILIACWLPVLLASYPGFFVYDAQDELNEVLTRNFTTHHPLIHVLLLGGIVAAGHKITGSYNLGIHAYMIFQMLILAGCFTYTLDFLKRHSVCKWFRILAVLFFGFFPVLPMYVLCSTKDTLFTAALLIMVLLMYDMLTNPDVFFSKRLLLIAFGVSIFLMISFRHNGFYAFLVLAPILLLRLFFDKDIKEKGYGKRVLVTILISLVFYVVVNKCMVVALNADTSENQEMLTVPIMQLTRVHEIEPDAYTQEQKDTLYRFLSKEAMSKYTPRLSDSVKVEFDNEYYKGHKKEFWKLWFSVGVSNPGAYVNAWLYTSYGFWYPDTIINVYGGIQRYTFVYGDSSYFGYETELPGVRESKFPFLNEIYRKLSLDVTQQRVPVFSMLFSPGFMFWLYAFALVFFINRRYYDRVLTLVIVMLLWLTVLLGPTYMVRYVLIFWFMLPVLLAWLLEKKVDLSA